MDPMLPPLDPNQPIRFLNWEATLNTRELGGYPLKNGEQTRWKTLVRSENPSLLTPAGQQALIDYGIRTIIDLRFPSELIDNPSPFQRKAGHGNAPDYLNIPLDQDQNATWPHPGGPAAAMADLYRRLLETSRKHVACSLKAIAGARPGGVLFHCFAGKDRTGLIAALILGALGASHETIIADYALAHPLFDERRARLLQDPGLPEEEREYLRVAITNLPDTMRLTLDYLDRTYGGIAGYLETTALLPEDLERLKERVVERP